MMDDGELGGGCFDSRESVGLRVGFRWGSGLRAYDN